MQLTVRVKPAQEKRPGRNPATGEEITIAAQPASVDLRARPLAKGKRSAPFSAEGQTPAGCMRSSGQQSRQRNRLSYAGPPASVEDVGVSATS